MTTEAVHYKIPGDTSCRFPCGQWDDDEDTPRTDEAGTATCPGCRKAAGEAPANCGGPGLCDTCSRALAAVRAGAAR